MRKMKKNAKGTRNIRGFIVEKYKNEKMEKKMKKVVDIWKNIGYSNIRLVRRGGLLKKKLKIREKSC